MIAIEIAETRFSRNLTDLVDCFGVAEREQQRFPGLSGVLISAKKGLDVALQFRGQLSVTRPTVEGFERKINGKVLGSSGLGRIERFQTKRAPSQCRRTPHAAELASDRLGQVGVKLVGGR